MSKGLQEKNGLTPELIFLGPNWLIVSASAKKGEGLQMDPFKHLLTLVPKVFLKTLHLPVFKGPTNNDNDDSWSHLGTIR